MSQQDVTFDRLTFRHLYANPLAGVVRDALQKHVNHRATGRCACGENVGRAPQQIVAHLSRVISNAVTKHLDERPNVALDKAQTDYRKARAELDAIEDFMKRTPAVGPWSTVAEQYESYLDEQADEALRLCQEPGRTLVAPYAYKTITWASPSAQVGWAGIVDSSDFLINLDERLSLTITNPRATQTNQEQPMTQTTEQPTAPLDLTVQRRPGDRPDETIAEIVYPDSGGARVSVSPHLGMLVVHGDETVPDPDSGAQSATTVTMSLDQVIAFGFNIAGAAIQAKRLGKVTMNQPVEPGGSLITGEEAEQYEQYEQYFQSKPQPYQPYQADGKVIFCVQSSKPQYVLTARTIPGDAGGLAKIFLTRNGDLVQEASVPAYRVYNYAAHVEDLVFSHEEMEREMKTATDPFEGQI